MLDAVKRMGARARGVAVIDKSTPRKALEEMAEVGLVGRGSPATGPSQPDFVALLDLVKSGRAYVKISGAYRVSEKAPDYPDVIDLAKALVAANPAASPGAPTAASEFRLRPRQAV